MPLVSWLFLHFRFQAVWFIPYRTRRPVEILCSQSRWTYYGRYILSIYFALALMDSDSFPWQRDITRSSIVVWKGTRDVDDRCQAHEVCPSHSSILVILPNNSVVLQKYCGRVRRSYALRVPFIRRSLSWSKMALSGKPTDAPVRIENMPREIRKCMENRPSGALPSIVTFPARLTLRISKINKAPSYRWGLLLIHGSSFLLAFIYHF